MCNCVYLLICLFSVCLGTKGSAEAKAKEFLYCVQYGCEEFARNSKNNFITVFKNLNYDDTNKASTG